MRRSFLTAAAFVPAAAGLLLATWWALSFRGRWVVCDAQLGLLISDRGWLAFIPRGDSIPVPIWDGRDRFGYFAVRHRYVLPPLAAVSAWCLSPLARRVAGKVRRLRAARSATAAGRCRACGYDLRATPDRCPECGTPRPVPAPSR